jgi:hypothetical protein
MDAMGAEIITPLILTIFNDMCDKAIPIWLAEVA